MNRRSLLGLALPLSLLACASPDTSSGGEAALVAAVPIRFELVSATVEPAMLGNEPGPITTAFVSLDARDRPST